jgi:hypothetical protein
MTRSAKRTFAPMGYPSREKWAESNIAQTTRS